MTTEQYQDLTNAAHLWLKVLGHSTENIQDLISAAFIKVYQTCSTYDEIRPIWKNALKQATNDAWRQERRCLALLADNYIDDTMEHNLLRKDFVKHALGEAYTHISEENAVRVLHLAEQEGSFTDAANAHGQERSAFQHCVLRLRKMLDEKLPDLFEKRQGGSPVERIRKTKDWNINYQKHEIMYEPRTETFFDEYENKVFPCNRVKVEGN